jgi:hypothetical protein
VFPDIMADAQTAFSKHQGSRPQVKTPEPRQSRDRLNGHKDPGERSPSTPGHLAPFDWDEFEARYEEALADADRDEQELLREFEELVKVSQVKPKFWEGFWWTFADNIRTVFQCLGLCCLSQ